MEDVKYHGEGVPLSYSDMLIGSEVKLSNLSFVCCTVSKFVIKVMYMFGILLLLRLWISLSVTALGKVFV